MNKKVNLSEALEAYKKGLCIKDSSGFIYNLELNPIYSLKSWYLFGEWEILKKEKCYKQVIKYQVLYSNFEGYHLSSDYFESKEDFLKNNDLALWNNSEIEFIRLIEETKKICLVENNL